MSPELPHSFACGSQVPGCCRTVSPDPKYWVLCVPFSEMGGAKRVEKGSAGAGSCLSPGLSVARDDGIFPCGLFGSWGTKVVLPLVPQSPSFRRLSFRSAGSRAPLCAPLYQPFLTLLPARLHPSVGQGSERTKSTLPTRHSPLSVLGRRCTCLGCVFERASW